VQDAGEVVHVLHQPIVLRAGAGDADRVAFLESVVADQVRRHLAGDADDRDGIHHRVGERRHHVGRPGTGRDQRHAGLAGRARIPLGGVAGALLVADQDVLHLVLLEKLVVDRQHGAAGIAEDVLHALVGERPQDHFRAGHLLCHLSTPWTRAAWRRTNKKGPRRTPVTRTTVRGGYKAAPVMRNDTISSRFDMKVM
jgi:hypothetical protein